MENPKRISFVSMIASFFATWYFHGKQILITISVILIALGSCFPNIRFGVGVTLIILVASYCGIIYVNKTLLRASLKYVIQGLLEILQIVVEAVENLDENDFDIDHTDSLLIKEKILRDRILEMCEDLTLKSGKLEIDEFNPELDKILDLVNSDYYRVVSIMDEHIIESCHGFHDAYEKFDYELNEGLMHIVK